MGDFDEFTLVRDFVTLCRSGDYKKRDQVFEKMRQLHPGITDEQLLEVVNRCYPGRLRGE